MPNARIILNSLLTFVLLSSAFADSPPKETPALVKKGKTIFKTRCISCHAGTDYATYPFKKGSDAESIFKTVTNGIDPAMPAMGSLSEEDRWAVTYYVESLRKKAK